MHRFISDVHRRSRSSTRVLLCQVVAVKTTGVDVPDPARPPDLDGGGSTV